MKGLTDVQAHRASLEIEFQETQWQGCMNLDCYSQCRSNPDDWYCARFEQAFRTWLKRRTVRVTSTTQNTAAE